MNKSSCFKAYDVRGEIGKNIDEDVCYRIGRAVAQHFKSRSVVIGFDARETSPCFSSAASRGVRDAGGDVIWIGMAGTEEMYWAVTEFGACAGIEVTASHNPINFNGMKIVKSCSQPLSDTEDFQVIRKLVEDGIWESHQSRGAELDRAFQARKAYVDRVVSFFDFRAVKPLKIVVNSGNGAAGPTFDAVAERLREFDAPIEFVRINHSPDHTFPNGVPNPIIPKNHRATADIIKNVYADFGIAFDGDFDRCFFFDENGAFVPGECVVGMLASIFLQNEAGSKIVHDPRVVWNIQDIVNSFAGTAIQSQTGHAFIKKAMRENKAVYGGELSAHHYFRDFAYCDSGMIPWILMVGLISRSQQSLGSLVKDRISLFPSSGEINFHVDDPHKSIERVWDAFQKDAILRNQKDGLSLELKNWRFNLRNSNTESLVRLNIETRGNSNNMDVLVDKISRLIGGRRMT